MIYSTVLKLNFVSKSCAGIVGVESCSSVINILD